MIAYKFLRAGAVGPFSGFEWPTPGRGEPGPWVEAETPLRLCLRGIHACRVEQLPHWIEAELWEVELAQPVQDADEILVSARGRLLRRIHGWDTETAHEFERACAWRARDHAVAGLGSHPAALALAGALSFEQIATRALEVAETVEGTARHAVEYTADLTQVVGKSKTSLVAEIAARVAAAAQIVRGGAIEAEADERRWQAGWLADRLDLSVV